MLSIVVGTYNRRDQLARLVDSIERETVAPYVLHISDAGSTDGTIAYLESVASDVVRPTFAGERLGQARAYNAIFRQVETPFVCWLSDDNEIVNNSLDKAVSILEQEPRIGMVGLKTKDVRGPLSGTSYIGAISSIGILNVNQGVLRTAILRVLGGFNEALVDYGVDPDLTARLLYMGHDIVYMRDVAVRHYRNWGEDPTSAGFRAVTDRRDRGIEMYERIHGSEERGGGLLLKRSAWRWARILFARRINLSINSQMKILGSTPRDYYNTFHAKHISAFDPILTLGKPYHLRQRMKRRLVAAEQFGGGRERRNERAGEG